MNWRGDNLMDYQEKQSGETPQEPGCDAATEAAETAATGAAEITTEEQPAEANEVLLAAQLAAQTKLAEENFNRLARVQADYDNFKRRTRQEKEDFYKYASEQLITALLPVLDNFDRAIAVEGGSVESFKAGVEMIHRQLWELMREEGLTAVPAVGEPFDPTVHEAVMQEESDEYPENVIIEELQRGYLLKEKLIRVAMVKIAKTG